jgi:hypothetical protein
MRANRVSEVSEMGDGTSSGSEALAPMDRRRSMVRRGLTQNVEPLGYITTDFLAELWDERSRQVEELRQAIPDDPRALEARQRLATQALQAYRILADLEQQLGLEVALPVLGPKTSAE